MAQKKITADLNGGDAVTAMGDLVFQVHDASDDSIIATANYAAIGSDNTNGTDGANIVYTLDETGGAGSNGQIILDGVEIGSVADIKIRCKDESGNESILSSSFAVVTDYKIVTSGATDNDKLVWDAAERIVMPASGNWIFEVKAKSLLATSVTRHLSFGQVNNFISLMSDGDIQYRESTGGIICDFKSAQADLGATTTVGAFNDGLQHTYKISWTLLDTGVKLSIDGVDFGVSTTTTAAPIDTFTPNNLGFQTTKEPWEFEWLKITVGATLYEYKFNEGSGLVAETEAGTANTINLLTDNATGQEARMWQVV